MMSDHNLPAGEATASAPPLTLTDTEHRILLPPFKKGSPSCRIVYPAIGGSILVTMKFVPYEPGQPMFGTGATTFIFDGDE